MFYIDFNASKQTNIYLIFFSMTVIFTGQQFICYHP